MPRSALRSPRSSSRRLILRPTALAVLLMAVGGAFLLFGGDARFDLGAVLAPTGVLMLGIGPMPWFRAQSEEASRD